MTKGKDGFSKDYWDVNYSEPELMDGIINAKAHAWALKHLMAIELIDISTIIDFGFGLGFLYEEMINAFYPYKTVGVEPSDFAFKQFRYRYESPVETMKMKLVNSDMLSYLRANVGKKAFDLGICTSVFQYLSEDEIDEALELMSKQVKYLYFSAPTTFEQKRMKEELEFVDEYAFSRSKDWYQKKIRKHFSFVSLRLLESKHFFSEKDSFFKEMIFRF